MPFMKVPLDAKELIQRQVNKEAEIYAHFMDRGNYYQDQYTADDRMGKKVETKWYLYLAGITFLIAIGFQLVDYGINLLDK